MRLKKLFDQNFKYLYEINNLKLKKKKKEAEIMKFSLQVAIERYEEAILQVNGDQAKRVAFAIMGMEALYNSDSDKETIGFKLKIRSSKILSFFGLNAIEIAKSISKAYGIRSSYAHGTATSKDLSFEFEEKIIDILRISIIIFLQIKITKPKFIQLMNESFYDKGRDKELISMLRNIKKAVNLNVNRKIYLL